MSELNLNAAELELARKLFWLIAQDAVFLSSYNSDKKDWDDGIYPAINCNDAFIPGADGESLHEEEIDQYIEVVKRWPMGAPLAWCAWKRGVGVRDVLSPQFKAQYDEALKYLKGSR